MSEISIEGWEEFSERLKSKSPRARLQEHKDYWKLRSFAELEAKLQDVIKLIIDWEKEKIQLTEEEKTQIIKERDVLLFYCEIASKIELVQRLIAEKKAPNKRLLLLCQLDNIRLFYGWNTDPDTIRGEKNAITCKRISTSPKKRQWAIKLAIDLLSKTDNFQVAWKKIPEFDDYSEELSIRRTTKAEKEGIELFEGAEPYPYLAKESFRTEYFQPAKKKQKKSEE